MKPELEAAFKSLQQWADANPEHIRALVGTRHAMTETGQQAINSGLSYFGAQLVAESFHDRTKPTAENRQALDSVTIRVTPTRSDMPPMWVVVSLRPMVFPELLAAIAKSSDAPVHDPAWDAAESARLMERVRESPVPVELVKAVKL